MRRWSITFATVVALAVAAPSGNAIVGDLYIGHTHGGYELTVGQITQHKVILQIHFDRRGKHRVRGRYRLCVWHGDRKHQCKTFRLEKDGGYSTDQVNFAAHFRHRHTGRYSVQWWKFGGPLSPRPLHFHYG
jgi:hypothetical protein